MNEMNRTQKEILYNSGNADYDATIERLDKVRQLTVVNIPVRQSRQSDRPRATLYLA